MRKEDDLNKDEKICVQKCPGRTGGKTEGWSGCCSLEPVTNQSIFEHTDTTDKSIDYIDYIDIVTAFSVIIPIC